MIREKIPGFLCGRGTFRHDNAGGGCRLGAFFVDLDERFVEWRLQKQPDDADRQYRELLDVGLPRLF